MSECLNFLFFIDAVKVLVCNCIQLKSFGMKCHLSMHVLTQDGLWKRFDKHVNHDEQTSPSSLESFWPQISPCNLRSLWWSSNIRF